MRSLANFGYDDIHEGQQVSFEHKVTALEIDAFAKLSGDVSPLHVSEEFAASRGFPGRVAHGALLTALSSRLFGVLLPGQDCLLQSLSMKYLLPVHAQDVLTFTAVVTQKADAVRAFTATVTVTAADGRKMAKGTAQVGFTGS